MSSPSSDQPAAPGWFGFALDFGPLLAFFAAYKLAGGGGGGGGGAVNQLHAILVSTIVFMIAIMSAVVLSKWRLGRVSPMLWLSAILILVFGGLTIWLHDQRFIQIKPTVIYVILAAILFAGLLRGRPMLRDVLGSAWTGLSDIGWLKLSRNWAWFFVAMAIGNEALRRSLSFDQWLLVKVWGVTIASVLFAFANLPMLLRHGLEMGDKVDPPEPPLG